MAEPERRRRRLRASSSSSSSAAADPDAAAPPMSEAAEPATGRAADAGPADAGPADAGPADAGPADAGPAEAPKPGPPATAKPGPADLARTGPAEPDTDGPTAETAETAETAAIVDGPGEPAGARVPRRSRPTSGAPFDDREAERGLRGLVGSGSSQVSVGAALRARDAARPTDAQVADAEQNLPIVRRNWTPREDLPRNR